MLIVCVSARDCLRLTVSLRLQLPAAHNAMVSSAAEAALHPKPEGGVDARHAAEVESMSHSLSASRNVMAALAPLASPADVGDGAAALNGEHAAGKTSSGLQKVTTQILSAKTTAP